MSARVHRGVVHRGTLRRAKPAIESGTPVDAFTLLEVMVAVTILAVSLASIFSSEAGAIRVAGRARHMTTASLLARCKMGELEEHLVRDGLPAVSENGTDECCEDAEVPGFECEWEVSRIVLPDQNAEGGDEDEEGEGGGGGVAGALAGILGGGGGEESRAATNGPPSVESLMSGSMLGGGGDMISQLAMQFVFPSLKLTIEEQVRRAQVRVHWHEGDAEQSFEITQYVIAEQPPALLTQQAAAAATQGTTPGTPTGQPIVPDPTRAQ